MDGKPAAPKGKVFDCPRCGSIINVTAVGSTVAAACRSCQTIVDVTSENLKVIQDVVKKQKRVPLIPLGTRGKLHGELFECIGFMVRCDGSGQYEWDEYLLYNPYKGFRWLTQFYGHWNYVVPLKTAPDSSDSYEATYLNRHYRHFLSGKAEVLYVVGEFYWQVRVGDKVSVSDYVHPPEMLSLEKDANESLWSLGTYTDREIVRQAFGIKEYLPTPTGVSPNQVSYWTPVYAKIRNIGLLAVVALFVLHILFMAAADNQNVYSSTFSFQPGTTATTITPQFELKGGTGNVAFDLQAAVQNNWLEAQIDLINDETDESMNFEQGVEYWSGYDGEYWSEGSQRSRIVLSGVPDGKYHLDVQSSSSYNAQLSYGIQVTRNTPMHWNFFICLILLALIPVYAFFAHHRFEYERWGEADASPYDWMLGGDDSED